MNRRDFLRSAVYAGGVASASTLAGCGYLKQSRVAIASSVKQNEQNYFRLCYDNGQLISHIALPGRGHGVAVNRIRQHIAMVARRPGNWVVVSDYRGSVVQQLKVDEHLRFNGHATYSLDGRFLFTTENDFSKQRGVISVWDAADAYRKVAEMPSHGIGPHELLVLDENTLVVANGGILTHPEKPREKLNLDSMNPSLVYMDLQSGEKKGEYRLNDPQQSIRHLAKDNLNQVVVALQYQGEKNKTIPLIAFHRGEEQLQYARAEDTMWQRLNHYTASAACNSKQNITAVTAPRGDQVTFWDTKSGELIKSEHCPDAAGVIYDENSNGFLVSNGRGEISHFSFVENKLISKVLFRHEQTQWDNHMNFLTV